MKPPRLPADRQAGICRRLRQTGVVRVAELSQMLGVSEITIRRDLETLEGKGLLERTHGGAISSQLMRTEPLFVQKDRRQAAEKEAIGRAAAALVEDGDTVLVGSGSTTLQMIRHLRARDVRLITSNAGAIAELAGRSVELILVGGLYRHQSNSLVGGFARLALDRIYASKAFIGVDGVSSRYGFTTPVQLEAEIGALMIERTRGPVIVLADHTKLGVVSNFATAALDDAEILVTDSGIDSGYADELAQRGLRVVVAQVPGS